jgi:hypothetical protein
MSSLLRRKGGGGGAKTFLRERSKPEGQRPLARIGHPGMRVRMASSAISLSIDGAESRRRGWLGPAATSPGRTEVGATAPGGADRTGASVAERV